MSLLSARAEEREVLESSTARFEVYRVGRDILVTRVSGLGGTQHIRRLIARSDELIARVGAISVVHDWFGVAGYDSSVRTLMTPWALKTRHAHRGIHIGTNASIVQMGVTLVRIATGAPIHSYKSMASLEAGLVAAVQEHGDVPVPSR